MHADAILGNDVSIGPFTLIADGVEIGDGCKIGSNVVIEKGTVLGKGCQVYPGAVLGGDPQISNFEDIPSGVQVGDGTIIREYVTLHRSGKEGGITRVGSKCMLMAYCHIGHDCKIGNEVVIVNSTGLSGHVEVEDFAFLSGITGVHQFVRIGKYAFVGGGMIVRQDIIPFSMVTGEPPRLKGINRVGLERRGIDQNVRSRLKNCVKYLIDPVLNTSQAVAKIEEKIEMCEEIGYLINFIKNSSRGVIK